VTGTLLRMIELYPRKRLTLLKSGDTRRVGKPQLRWVESVEEDLKNVDSRNWRRVTGPRTVEDSFFLVLVTKTKHVGAAH
jgi:hypothetical protein